MGIAYPWKYNTTNKIFDQNISNEYFPNYGMMYISMLTSHSIMLFKMIMFLPHEFNHLTVCSRLENRQRYHNVFELLKLEQTCTNKNVLLFLQCSVTYKNWVFCWFRSGINFEMPVLVNVKFLIPQCNKLSVIVYMDDWLPVPITAVNNNFIDYRRY